MLSLVVAVAAAIIAKIAGSEIRTDKGIVFILGTIGVAFLAIVAWYNAIGIVYSLTAMVQERALGCPVALRTYKDAVNANPWVVPARVGLVNCSLALERPADAISVLEPQSVSLHDSWQYWQEMAYLYGSTGSYAKLLDAINRAANLSPLDTNWITDYGEQLLRAGQYATAEGSFRVVRMSNLDDRRALFWLSWALYEQRKLDDAMGHFDKCIAAYSDEIQYELVRCHAGKGLSLFLQQRPGEAEAELTLALALDPSQEDVRGVLASMH